LSRRVPAFSQRLPTLHLEGQLSHVCSLVRACLIGTLPTCVEEYDAGAVNSTNKMGQLIVAPFCSFLYRLLGCQLPAALADRGWLGTWHEIAELFAIYLAIIGCALEIEHVAIAIET